MSISRCIQLRYYDQLRLAAIALLMAVIVLGYLGLTQWQTTKIDLNDHPPVQDVPLFQVDLNHFQWYELVILPGIGETLAKAIVDHRSQHGDFTRIEEIQHVSGIEPGKFEQLAPHLTIKQ